MIETLKPYASYRTGAFALPPLPDHWAVRRTKSLLREVDRRTTSGRERLLSLRMNVGLVDHRAMGGKHIPPSSLVGYKRVLPGELVMNRMRAAIGLFGAATSEGLVSPDYAIFDVSAELKVDYAVALFRTPVMASLFRLESRGLGTGESGFLRLYSDRFGILRMPLPPPEEQTTIVRFLDHANRRIDRFIRAKKKLIALLNEQKQAIIHRAVTRGLDPDVELKDSGVPWIGEIPTSWTIRRLKALSQRISGRLVYQPAQYFSENGVPFLMANNVTADGIRWRGVKRIPVAVNDRFARHALHEGDVVTVRVGAPGTTCVVPSEADGLNCGSLMIIRRSAAFDSRWLAHVMNSSIVREQIHAVQYGAAQEQINIGDAINFWLPVPPRDEQTRIADRIDANTTPVLALVNKLTREVEFIREYRTRLISDVVTGQLDVRAAAASLPDPERDAPPAEPADDDTDLDDTELDDTELDTAEAVE